MANNINWCIFFAVRNAKYVHFRPTETSLCTWSWGSCLDSLACLPSYSVVMVSRRSYCSYEWIYKKCFHALIAILCKLVVTTSSSTASECRLYMDLTSTTCVVWEFARFLFRYLIVHNFFVRESVALSNFNSAYKHPLWTDQSPSKSALNEK